MTIARLEPIPTPELYDQAFSSADKELQQYGGIKFHLDHRAFMVKHDRDLQDQDMKIARYGMLFADQALIQDDEEAFNASYAYIHGYMLTDPVMDELYESPHTFENRFTPIDTWVNTINANEGHDADEYIEQQRKHIETYGGFGLRQLGGIALQTLVNWSNEAYPDHHRMARMFCLGSGAMITGAQMYQRSLNEWIINQMDANNGYDTVQDIFGDNNDKEQQAL